MKIDYDPAKRNRITIVPETDEEFEFLNNPGVVDYANFIFYDKPITEELIHKSLELLRQAFLKYVFDKNSDPNFDVLARYQPEVVKKKLRTRWDITSKEEYKKLGLEILDEKPKKFIKKIIRNQHIRDNATYQGCSFYFDDSVRLYVQGSTFDNCSFRTNIYFERLKNCKFTNCNFSGEVLLATTGFDVDLTYMKEILGYTFLTQLNLSGVDFRKPYWHDTKHRREFMALDFSTLVNLKVLEMHDQGLNSVPSSIGYCPNLEKLDLCNNKIETLPEEFQALKKLKVLCLSANRFEALPSEIGYMDALETFIFRHNPCLYINYEFLHLKFLQRMVVDRQVATESTYTESSFYMIYRDFPNVKESIDYMNDTNVKYYGTAINFIALTSQYMQNTRIKIKDPGDPPLDQWEFVGRISAFGQGYDHKGNE